MSVNDLERITERDVSEAMGLSPAELARVFRREAADELRSVAEKIESDDEHEVSVRVLDHAQWLLVLVRRFERADDAIAAIASGGAS